MSKDHTTYNDETPGSNELSAASPPEAAPSDPRTAYPAVLTAAELAEIMRVDRRVIYKMVRDHQIPGVRLFGRQLRFDRDVVLEWLRDGQGCASRSSGRSSKHER
jgi:excisionase family DNA binding protein